MAGELGVSDSHAVMRSVSNALMGHDLSYSFSSVPKRRQVLLTGKDIFVLDDLDARVIHVQPRGHLPVGDDVDVAYPRCMRLHGPQRVPQLAVVCGSDRPPLA